MKFKNVLLIILISSATAFLSVWGYGKYIGNKSVTVQQEGKLPVNYAGFFDKNNSGGPVDFTAAASAATPAVVHIKTIIKERKLTQQEQQRNNPFSDLFGDNDPFSQFFGGPRVMPEQRASGSGVLISSDGYIITNNHVIDGADEVTVTTNERKTYKGTVVAKDVNTDLALVKINDKNLPFLVFGNSDDVKLGQWVLAIGYPLTLDVTVTAGIVSAKSRSIGINKGSAPIESFIQTDAAVNPGNSGGPLINTNGELIGINSAIASPTGAYAGYSYAIPVNIVKKIASDLMKYGVVQRAFIGIAYPSDNLTDDQKKQYGIKDGDGIFVTDAPEGGAAQQAGIRKGDFVTKINGVAVHSGPELQEQVANFKPGDKITITYTRDGKENTIPLTLKNKAGNYSIVKSNSVLDNLGADLVTIDKQTAKENNLKGGVQVQKIGNGLMANSRIQEGFIIIAANGQPVTSTEDLATILSNAHGTIKIDGVYPGYGDTYTYPLRIDSDDN
ncbi:MAG: trypsin-like peptidase domain-containing protein [Bacteroidetes bacterium]|nr:trypsin-like peptidase domain-containing protein [Bacteroidota bacterium]